MYSRGGSPVYQYSNRTPSTYDDQIQASHDFRQTQDIMLSIKKLQECVQAQSQQLNEIQNQLAAKASKNELLTGLNTKANITDISYELNHLRDTIESRAPYIELQRSIEDKISRSEVMYMLNKKLSKQDIEEAVQNVVQRREHEGDIIDLRNRIEASRKELLLKFEELNANPAIHYNNLDALLSEKANKQSVISALQRKANVQDVEESLAQKVSNEDFEQVWYEIDNKVDKQVLYDLMQGINGKIDRQEISVLLPDIGDFRQELDNIKRSLNQVQQKFGRVEIEEIQHQIQKVQNECNQLKLQFSQSLSKKADRNEIDQLSKALNTKADQDVINTINRENLREINNLITQSKKENVNEGVSTKNFYMDLNNIKTQLFDSLNDRLRESDAYLKQLKHNNQQFTTDVNNELSSMNQEIERMGATIDEMESKKADRGELLDLKATTEDLQSNKVDSNDFEEKFEQIQYNYEQLQGVIQGLSKSESENHDTLESINATITSLQSDLQQKTNTSDFNQHIKNTAKIQQLSKVVQELTALSSQLASKASTSELDAHISQTKTALQEVGKDMVLKANINDVCDLLETKANIVDINKILTDLQHRITQNISQEIFYKAISSHFSQLQKLNAENQVASWI